MRIEQGVKLDFSDVLLVPKRSTLESRKEVDITRTFKFRWSNQTPTVCPIISSNMTSVTTREVANKMSDRNMLACVPKMANWEGMWCANWIPSFGLDWKSDPNRTGFVCLDVPNGYMESVVEQTQEMRQYYGLEVTIIVGNVVTAEQTEALILAGADIVKVGIGSGSACSTRIKTGVGMPQLSAVIECADAAHGLGGHIISDGGCTTPGDIVKAFAGGADFVMLGGMLSGCLENGTEFYGMSSERANNEFSGGLKNYRAAEGFEMQVPSKGPIEGVLQDIEGGLRSACSYVGAKRLKDLPKCATFVRVNNQVNKSLWEYRNA